MVEGDGYREAVKRIAEVRISRASELSLANLKLKELPPDLADLSILHSIDLEGNYLRTLPDWFSELGSLEFIELSRNDLREIPRCLRGIGGLRKLDLHDNGLNALPDWFGGMSGLTKLDLSLNEFNSLPDWSTGLVSLQDLSLWGNDLRVLPNWLGGLSALESIDLSLNKFKQLPECLRGLTRLLSLDLSGNTLAVLPDWLAELVNIQVFSLSGVGLQVLPECLSKLVDLRILDISRNNLESMPDWVANLKKLRRLDLSRNNVKMLPELLGQLVLLEDAARASPLRGGLNVEQNPLPSPYPALIALGQPEATANVLAYLRGEIDLAAQSDAKLIAPTIVDDASKSPTDIAEQRPAAYRFGPRGGRIDALPEFSGPIDTDTAADLLAELLDKAHELRGRLAAANADPRVRRSVDRLIEALTAEPLRPGLVLSRSRTIEADRDAFDSPQGRAELFPDAIARMNDVLFTARDLLAAYPVVRQIERERLALDIERRHLEPVADSVAEVAHAAALSESVTPTAAAALRAQDEAIAEAPTQAVKAELIADAVLVAENFARAVVQATDQAETAVSADLPEEAVLALRQMIWAKVADAAGSASRRAGSELSDLGDQCWQEIRENFPAGVGDVSRIAPLVALSGLLMAIYGPVGVLASLLPTLKPLAAAIKSLKGRTKPKSVAPTSPSATAPSAAPATQKRSPAKSRKRKPPKA